MSCRRCGKVITLPDPARVGPTVACDACRESNPTWFVCRSCGTRSSLGAATLEAPEAPLPEFACPMCDATVDASAISCPACGTDFLLVERPRSTPKVRPRRRVRGDYDESAIDELARAPGVGRARAEALCRAGYAAPWKIRAARVEDLAAIRGIGAEAARTIKESLGIVLILPPRKAGSPMAVEYTCPACGCITSVFATICHDCGAGFEEEEIEPLLADLVRNREQAELAFYEVRLMEDRRDPDLWYARGQLLRDLGQLPEAIASFDRALQLTPDVPRVQLARASVLSELQDIGRAARQFREAISSQVRALEGQTDRRRTESESAEPIRGTKVPAAPSRRNCGACGEPVKPGATRCPACFASLVPVPGTTAPLPGATPEEARASDRRFRSLEGLRRIGVDAAAPETQRSRVAAPGRINGESLVHGRGRTNGHGLVKGPGRINGQGQVNGRGRVNGFTHRSGFVNGGRLTHVRPSRSIARAAFVALACAMAVAFTVTIFPAPDGGLRITVDGDQRDWSGVPRFEDPVPAANPNVTIQSYALLLEGESVSVLVNVLETAFGDAMGLDAIYVFFDADGDPTSGYAVRDIGAEAVLEVHGGAGFGVSAAVYEWPSGAMDRSNWSAFSHVGPARAAASGHTLEAQFPMAEVPLADTFRALVHANDFEGGQSFASVAIGSQPSALLVTQSSAPASGIVASSGDPILRVRFTSFGGPVPVLSTTLEHPIGGGTLGALSMPMTVIPGSPVVVDVPIAFTAAEAGTLVTAGVASVDAAGRPVTIARAPAVAYLQAAPTAYRIDGYFGEWAAKAIDSDPRPIANPNVDIAQFQTGLSGSTTFLYAQAVGEILGGAVSPVIRVRPLPGSGGSGDPQGALGVPLRRSGEDVFRAFIDADSRDAAGAPVAGIHADYVLEVRGTNGRITSARPYRWVGTWQPATLTVAAMNEGGEIEASVDLLGASVFDLRVVLEATDWSAVVDSTDPALTRVSGFRVVPLAVPGLGLFGNPPGAQLLQAPPLSGSLAVDGSCGDTGYANAGTSTQANMTVKAGRNGGSVWICIVASFDTTNDGGDVGRIHFNRDDGGEPGPGGGDRRFSVSPGGAIAGHLGTGSDWVACTFSASPSATECNSADQANATFSTTQVYEFKIAYDDVWNTSSPSSNQRAGFAIRLLDASNGTTYTWGSTSVDVSSTDLDTWGRLEIHSPEFQDYVLAAVSILIVFGVLRRRAGVRVRQGA